MDVKPIDGSDPVDNALIILNELAKFSTELSKLPQILVLNKIDQLGDDVHEVCQHIVKALDWQGEVFYTSTISGQGVDEIKYHLMNEIELERERERDDEEFAKAQAERFARLEQEVRHNTEIQKEAYRAKRKAEREGVSDDDDEWNEDDYDVAVEYAPY